MNSLDRLVLRARGIPNAVARDATLEAEADIAPPMPEKPEITRATQQVSPSSPAPTMVHDDSSPPSSITTSAPSTPLVDTPRDHRRSPAIPKYEPMPPESDQTSNPAALQQDPPSQPPQVINVGRRPAPAPNQQAPTPADPLHHFIAHISTENAARETAPSAPAPTAAAVNPTVTIGRIEITIAPPPPPTAPPPRSTHQRTTTPRTSGFAGYARLRRGLER